MSDNKSLCDTCKYMFTCERSDIGISYANHSVCYEYAIDNTPTVPNEYMRGYEDAEREYKRPQGEWIIVKDERYGDNVKCPFCGKELAGTDLNFCCKCGAKLIGSEKMN